MTGIEQLLEPEHFDWEALVRAVPILAEMDGCLQEPEHHGEGDVAIHTRMVVSELLKLPEFETLTDVQRSILFAAAVLHDIAKPRTRGLDEDGVIRFPNHARLGERLAR